MGLFNLEWIGNPVLTDISGLSNIESSSIGYIQIWGNYLLSDCAIESICGFLASPNGEFTMYENAEGCNTLEEVEAACMTRVGQLDGWTVGQLPVRVFPNPFLEIVHFEFEIKNPSPLSIQVFNALGERVAVLSDGLIEAGQHQIMWNATNLPSGLYFVRLIAGKEAAGVKLIKQ